MSKKEHTSYNPQTVNSFLGVVSGSVLYNRSLFLSELRSGKYKKGTIKSYERGLPVFDLPRSVHSFRKK